jgi:hypothetical protein
MGLKELDLKIVALSKMDTNLRQERGAPLSR